jgi:ABC-type cobalamin/Fe3+-siderophores transport system ATPase subunit
MDNRYAFKINNIKFKNGENLEPSKINIIIGPNNAGKSKFLREISGFFYGKKEEMYILNDLNFELPKSYRDFYKNYDLENKIITVNGNNVLRTYFNCADDFYYPFIQDEKYFEKDILCKENYKEFLHEYGCLFLNYLGTENRLTMIKMQE